VAINQVGQFLQIGHMGFFFGNGDIKVFFNSEQQLNLAQESRPYSLNARSAWTSSAFTPNFSTINCWICSIVFITLPCPHSPASGLRMELYLSCGAIVCRYLMKIYGLYCLVLCQLLTGNC
jgi:hypothetical protein